MTLSDYGHLGIAMWKDGRLLTVEATSPYVRVAPVSQLGGFFHIPMGIEWDVEYEIWLMSKVGLPYSFSDAIRAYFGLYPKIDGRLQCVELVDQFYTHIGIDIGAKRLTPNAYVNKLLESRHVGIFKVHN